MTPPSPRTNPGARLARLARLVRPALSLLLAAALAGCVSIWNIGPGAVTPGLVHGDVGYPNAMGDDTVLSIPYDPGRIELIGWVETENASSTLGGRIPGLGGGDILGHRDSDYGKTLRMLMEQHDIDGLLNKTVDTRRWALDLYLVRYYRMHTHLGGVGYRFRDRATFERFRGNPAP